MENPKWFIQHENRLKNNNKARDENRKRGKERVGLRYLHQSKEKRSATRVHKICTNMFMKCGSKIDT